MFSKIASITLPIFTLVLVGFLYSRHVKPDLGGANKLVVDVALPVLIFISLSSKSFDPISALSFTGASIVLIFVIVIVFVIVINIVIVIRILFFFIVFFFFGIIR